VVAAWALTPGRPANRSSGGSALAIKRASIKGKLIRTRRIMPLEQWRAVTMACMAGRLACSPSVNLAEADQSRFPARGAAHSDYFALRICGRLSTRLLSAISRRSQVH
jgi:hypothetical protein